MKKLFFTFESSSFKILCFFIFFILCKNVFSLENIDVDQNPEVLITETRDLNNADYLSQKQFEQWDGDTFFDIMPGETNYDLNGKLLSISFFKDLKNIYTDYYLYSKNGDIRGVKRVYTDGTESVFFSTLKDGGSYREFSPVEKINKTNSETVSGENSEKKIVIKTEEKNVINPSEFRYYDSLSRELSREIVLDGKIIDYQTRNYLGSSQIPSEFIQEKGGEKTVIKYTSSGKIEKIVKSLTDVSSDQTIFSYNGNGDLISKLEVIYDNQDLQEKKETRYKYSKENISQVTIYINDEKQLERIYSVPGDEYADYIEKLYKNGKEVLEVLFSDGKKKTETVIDSGKKVRVRTFL